MPRRVRHRHVEPFGNVFRFHYAEKKSLVCLILGRPVLGRSPGRTGIIGIVGCFFGQWFEIDEHIWHEEELFTKISLQVRSPLS